MQKTSMCLYSSRPSFREENNQVLFSGYPNCRLCLYKVCLSSSLSSSEGNCLAQKFILPCLHSEPRHKNTQLTVLLRVRTAILLQLITLKSTGQKGTDIMKFSPREVSGVEETCASTFRRLKQIFNA